jgi:hypothetical protein
MTVSLRLANVLYLCPANWNRFIKDLESRLDHDEQDGFYIDTLNRELARFKARYIEDDKQTRVDFADERCYTMFTIAYGAL